MNRLDQALAAIRVSRSAVLDCLKSINQVAAENPGLLADETTAEKLSDAIHVHDLAIEALYAAREDA